MILQGGIFIKKIRAFFSDAMSDILQTSITDYYERSLIPDYSSKFCTSSFWISNISQANKIILNKNKIFKLNKINTSNSNTNVVDLTIFEPEISKTILLDLIHKFSIPSQDRYINGKKVDQTYYNNLIQKMHFYSLNEPIKVLFGITVKRTDIRSFPTQDKGFDSPDDIEFDYFQESALEIAEPLIILHATDDKAWYFIRSSNYHGWVRASNVGVFDNKKDWLNYLNPSQFLIITANKLKLEVNPYSKKLSELEFGMGVKLPLILDSNTGQIIDNQTATCSYTCRGNNFLMRQVLTCTSGFKNVILKPSAVYKVKIPTLSADGRVALNTVLIPISSDVSIGHLEYTRENILSQAFKLLGDRYGWGGMFRSRDCSGIILDIFKCFGIILPRNTSQQELSAGKTYLFENLDVLARKKILDKLSPGAALYMKNHVVLFLGKYEDRYYCIQAIYAYADKLKPNSDGSFEKIILNSTIVTTLDLPLKRNGKSILENLILAKMFE